MKKINNVDSSCIYEVKWLLISKKTFNTGDFFLLLIVIFIGILKTLTLEIKNTFQVFGFLIHNSIFLYINGFIKLTLRNQTIKMVIKWGIKNYPFLLVKYLRFPCRNVISYPKQPVGGKNWGIARYLGSIT